MAYARTLCNACEMPDDHIAVFQSLKSVLSLRCTRSMTDEALRSPLERGQSRPIRKHLRFVDKATILVFSGFSVGGFLFCHVSCDNAPRYNTSYAIFEMQKIGSRASEQSRATSTSMCRAMLNNVANMDNFALYLLMSRYVALNVALTYAIKKLVCKLK